MILHILYNCSHTYCIVMTKIKKTESSENSEPSAFSKDDCLPCRKQLTGVQKVIFCTPKSYLLQKQVCLSIQKSFREIIFIPEALLSCLYLAGLCLNAYFTNNISTGTSINGPMTAAKASPELIPNTAMETAMASSKLFPVAVNAMEADLS